MCIYFVCIQCVHEIIAVVLFDADIRGQSGEPSVVEQGVVIWAFVRSLFVDEPAIEMDLQIGGRSGGGLSRRSGTAFFPERPRNANPGSPGKLAVAG